MDPLFRPVNFLVPFTPQQGEITGVTNTHKKSAHTCPQNILFFRSLTFNRLTSAGEVRMPSGKTARPHITDNKDGTITIKYQPTEKGLHEMDIKYDGNHIPGQQHTMLDGWTGI